MFGTVLVALILSILVWPTTAPLAAALPQNPAQTSATGRVVATVTSGGGSVRLPGVQVELRVVGDQTVRATAVTDAGGQVEFSDVPGGRYVMSASRQGLDTRESAAFEVRPDGVAEVLIDIPLAFSSPPVDVRAVSPTAADEAQPVSVSERLDGMAMESVPLEGDDFQNLLPLLPGVIRGPDGRLRIKGGQPSQGALQVSSASLIDPSTGDFDLELPAPSVESVEVLANPFAAEYGRFSTSITQIRTRPGTNEWAFSAGNMIPRFRKFFSGIRAFEPRASARGPIRTDRIFFAQDVQFRRVGTPVKSLPDEPEVTLTSLDSFTRVDVVASANHIFDAALILFPRKVSHATMNTFQPPDVSPDLRQDGWSAGMLDRFALSSNAVLETTIAGRGFEIEVGPEDPERRQPMTFTPDIRMGQFFNNQERDVRSVQWVEALSLSRSWRGEHVIKLGADLQWARFGGFTESNPVEIRRTNGSLAELTVFSAGTEVAVAGTEVAVFAQDRWKAGSRLTFEGGLRLDRDAVVKRLTWSPRAGVALAVLPDGEAIIRGGVGKFVQRTPLNIEAFRSFETRVVSRFAADGSPLGAPVGFTHVVSSELRDPDAIVGNVEWNQRFGPGLVVKLGYLQRRGANEFLLIPDTARGELQLSSTGTSRYKEFEATTRVVGERHDLTLSYVWSRGTADLNSYDQFFGNFRNPIIRANEHNLTPTDVPHRVLVRGNIKFPGQWDFAPVLELRSGFPWSAVNEYQDFVGPRNRAGRLPVVRTLDFQLTRPWQFRKYRFRAGIKMYNVFGSFAGRDIQNNLTSAAYGESFNPIERSIGIAIGTGR